MSDASQIREAILRTPLQACPLRVTPQAETLYLPSSHRKALRLDAHIVIGGRGVGKSFWASVLQSDDLRRRLAPVDELKEIEVGVGFSSTSEIRNYPNADTFRKFLDEGGDPFDLWRAVMLRWVAERAGVRIPVEQWEDIVGWLNREQGAVARIMEGPRRWAGLLLFDELDRTSDDWGRMDSIVNGLFRAILWLRTFPGLHAKVFLRDDQAERAIFNFADASKLLATRAELTWERHDLHGLLWQRLINAPQQYGERLRQLIELDIERRDVWHLRPAMRRESAQQRKAFERLAGPWMGRDRRRGVPYSWAVGHLADGKGRTSPRSFLAAIHQAAEDSMRYETHEYALHYESIKRGIQKASEIRVQEIAEDHPWVPEVCARLNSLVVPMAFESMEKQWNQAFPEGLCTTISGLPPQHLDRGWLGIRKDLERLGIIETKRDGRIDMPDLYRVGFGLGRKGGVKPRTT